MKHQRLLLLRLRIKRDKKKIDDAIEWNFGYCPNEKWFDELLATNGKDVVEFERLKLELFFKSLTNKDR